MLKNEYMRAKGMNTDTYITGKIYAKLDAYIENFKGEFVYFCSSAQFKTQRRFKVWLRERYLCGDRKIIIKKADQ